MKFAHIRVSEYFTFAKQIFHSEAISLARRANFTEKSQVLRLGFFLGRGRRTRTRDPRFWRPVLYQLSYTPVYTCSEKEQVARHAGFEPATYRFVAGHSIH